MVIELKVFYINCVFLHDPTICHGAHYATCPRDFRELHGIRVSVKKDDNRIVYAHLFVPS